MLSWLAGQVCVSTQNIGLAPGNLALGGNAPSGAPERSGARESSGALTPPILTQNQAWVLELSHALKTL
ncbi:MAG: hypothetical protein HC922_00090 [Leptolyngbyaceae cyanobacterium SM2_3_12]|nr:hypothetical protein [Leptolyngbyaceae cyanobacterium SM2_3_12]